MGRLDKRRHLLDNLVPRWVKKSAVPLLATGNHTGPVNNQFAFLDYLNLKFVLLTDFVFSLGFEDY